MPKRQKVKLIYDRDLVMPHDENIERQVLGSIIILGNTAFDEIEPLLSQDAFYTGSNIAIFEAMRKLNSAKKPIDTVNIVLQLQSDGTLNAVGGATYVSKLASDVASTVHLKKNAQALKQMAMSRGLFTLSEQIKEMSTDPMCDVDDIIEYTEKELTNLQINTRSDILSFDDNISKFNEWLRNNAQHKLSISTGLCGLDKILCGGFRGPDLIVLGARPSIGKTQFAVHFAEQAAMQCKRVLFISIEMKAEQLIARMVAKNGVSYSNMREGKLSTEEWSRVDRNLAEIAQYDIRIADSPDCRSLSFIKSEARRMKRQGGLDMLIIDYAQLVRTGMRFDSRYLEVGYITSELKSLAKELNIPVILLAQLNRPASGQETKLPRMEDLRESGNIEQDADIIIFPHRPYVYDENAVDTTGRPWKDRGILLVGKNREGERNAKAYFMNDPAFKEFWDDEQANSIN